MSAKKLSVELGFLLLSMLLISSGAFSQARPGGQFHSEDATTAHWRTYRSRKYGFEVKYPPGFNVSEDPGGYVIFSVPRVDPKFGLSISRLRRRGKLTLNEFVHDDTAYEKDHTYGYAMESVVSRDGMTVCRFQKILGSSTRQGSFFLKDHDEGTMADYLIEYDRCNGGGCGPGDYTSDRFVKNPYTEQHDQILSTFRFIEGARVAGDQ